MAEVPIPKYPAIWLWSMMSSSWLKIRSFWSRCSLKLYLGAAAAVVARGAAAASPAVPNPAAASPRAVAPRAPHQVRPSLLMRFVLACGHRTREDGPARSRLMPPRQGLAIRLSLPTPPPPEVPLV